MRQLNTIIDSREYNDNNNKNREKKIEDILLHPGWGKRENDDEYKNPINREYFVFVYDKSFSVWCSREVKKVSRYILIFHAIYFMRDYELSECSHLCSLDGPTHALLTSAWDLGQP